MHTRPRFSWRPRRTRKDLEVLDASQVSVRASPSWTLQRSYVMAEHITCWQRIQGFGCGGRHRRKVPATWSTTKRLHSARTMRCPSASATAFTAWSRTVWHFVSHHWPDCADEQRRDDVWATMVGVIEPSAINTVAPITGCIVVQ